MLLENMAISEWGIKRESLAAIYGTVKFNMTAIYNLLSESFYLKLVTTCKNLFLSLVVVRLVIFFTVREASYIDNLQWKMTCNERLTLMEDNSWSKTSFDQTTSTRTLT